MGVPMTADLHFIWNIIHSLILVPVAWALVYLNSHINNLWKSVSETREEVPKVYVTKADVHNDLANIQKRFDRIEEKLDRLTADLFARR